MATNRVNGVEQALSLVRPDGPKLVFSVYDPSGPMYNSEEVHRMPTDGLNPSIIIPNGRTLFFRFPGRKGIFKLVEVRLTGIGRDIHATVVEVDRDQVLSAVTPPASP